MAVTNKYNLPLPLFKALSPERRQPVAGRFAATHLIDAPLRRILLMRYFDEIEEDAADSLWALLGKAVHKVLEEHGTKETSEKKIEFSHFTGSTLVTVGDYYDMGNVITDWKITSVWSLILGDKEEWHRQLEVERFIYEMAGLPVSALKVCAILRDFRDKEKFKNPDYPPIPFVEKSYKLWDHDRLLQYINKRVEIHLSAEKFLNEPHLIASCTAEERWEKPHVWAVMKAGQKRAVKLFDDPNVAEGFAHAKGLSVVHRPGESTKCERFCAVMPFCPYKEKFVKGKEIEE
jgi:hypothetical protein